MPQKAKSRSENVLLALTVSSVVLGVLLGFGCRSFEPSQTTIELINFPGEIFLQILKMMLLPLVIASLISALAQLDARESTKMGLLTLGYYFVTTTLAALTGMILVITIHPGEPQMNSDIHYQRNDTRLSPLDTYLDLIRNMFPENIIRATFQHQRTDYRLIKKQLWRKTDTEYEESVWKPIVEYKDGLNILGIIVFCTAFGIAISQLGRQARPMVDFFVILDAVIMHIVTVVMWCAPLGICCLICANILELDDVSNTAEMLALYIVTVLSGLFIHCFITLPLIFVIITRRNPIEFAKRTMQAFLTALGTSSSGAALPASFLCAEENNNIDRRVSRFVLPLGSNINMDGPALYEAVAVVFIAQLNGVDLSFAEIVTVAVTTTLASLGTGPIPAGLLPILVVLPAIGLPVNNISFIVTVDWLFTLWTEMSLKNEITCQNIVFYVSENDAALFKDRIRTALNVLCDGFAAAVIEKLTKTELQRVSTYNRELAEEIQEEIEQLNGPHPEHTDGHTTKPSDYN